LRFPPFCDIILNGKQVSILADKKEKKYVSDNAQLMVEWDWEKNKDFDPSTLTLGSGKKVWWNCKNGHQWEMSVSQRSRGQNCPYCSNKRVWIGYNDLATTHPKIVEEWDINKNTISPKEITFGSNKMIWWKCSLGHSYQMALYKKTYRNSSCPICSGYKIISGVNDFATCYPYIAKEWHPTKNGDLLPSMFSKKSGKKVWWKCQLGHEWKATFHDRAEGTGCPFCVARLSTSFPEQTIFFYIKKLFPDACNRYRDIFDNGMELDVFIPSIRLAIEFDGANWHCSDDSLERELKKYEICKQNDIKLVRIKEKTSDSITKTSADKIFFIRKRSYEKDLVFVIQSILDDIDPQSNMWFRKNPSQIHSHVTIDLSKDRNEIRKYLSPITTNKSLSNLRPDLVQDWNVKRNGQLTPNMFGINSNDRVWWKCRQCGHEWETTIISRGNRNSGCPECSKIKRGKTFTAWCVSERGSLADNNPILAEEWHPTKNLDLTPHDITERRYKKVWWLCRVCGYEWEASPLNRSSKGVGCPACSGRVPRIGKNDFKTLYPLIAREWCYEKNGELLPEHFLPKSGKKVWWRCTMCGNEWKTDIRVRTNGHNCPICARKNSH